MTNDRGMPTLEFLRHKVGLTFELPNDGHHVAIHFPPTQKDGRGRMSGFAPPPRYFTNDRLDPQTVHLAANERLFLQGDPSSRPASLAMLAANTWGATLKALAFDDDKSEPAKLKGRIEATVVCLLALSRQYVALEAIREKLEPRHAKLYAVPEADAAAAAVDVEARAIFRTKSHPEQMILASEGDTPANERMLFAVLRSPVKFADAVQEQIDKTWVARVTRENPLEVAELALEEAMNAWARGFVQHLGECVASPNFNGTDLSRFEIYRMLREEGATGLLQWQDGEADANERRIAEVVKS